MRGLVVSCLIFSSFFGGEGKREFGKGRGKAGYQCLYNLRRHHRLCRGLVAGRRALRLRLLLSGPLLLQAVIWKKGRDVKVKMGKVCDLKELWVEIIFLKVRGWKRNRR